MNNLLLLILNLFELNRVELTEFFVDFGFVSTRLYYIPSLGEFSKKTYLWWLPEPEMTGRWLSWGLPEWDWPVAECTGLEVLFPH